ncbi:molybdopterin-dependent oxidoreductase [Porifericola rhodea]|uniref:molybdopterin cofactor-binding domain-containing protein n=1 Tax=Porifericola rhodea TaxID=930972 RepID=UPI0026659AF7|nr:molybdopterin cofactor-binding domain-containing protein [Porifericola rhodea]WKN32692.1 molybdopterin-dependent oxidoreductase [Porifericola rhodea]
MNRRNFLKVSGASGAVLTLGFAIPSVGQEAEVFKVNAEGVSGAQLNPFVIIDEAGKVTIMNHKPEMGQGVFQSMPMLVAEELEVDMEEVHVVQGLGNKNYGSQIVGGSNSVRGQWEPLRKMGAAAREMLQEAAAKRWKTKVSKTYAEKGKVYHKKSGKSFTYGQLIADAAKLEAPKDPQLKEHKNFKVLGQPLARKDAPAKVDGSAVFGIDLEMPRLLYATVERPPTIHGKVLSFDDTAAKAIPGVKHVLKTERHVFGYKLEGVAVVADSYYTATKGRKALKIEWDLSGFEDIDSRKIHEELVALKAEDGLAHKSIGDFKEGIQSAAKTIEAEYELPYLAHSPMEPMNMTAHVKKDGSCEVWGPTQSPQWAMRDLAGYLDIPEEKIKVNVTFLGGGFGRRAFNDFVIEAASISRQINEPVKVIWTREDDTQQGPFRPGTYHHLQAGFDAEGNPTSLQHKMIGQALSHQWPDADKSKLPGGVMEAINTGYAFPNLMTRYVPYESQIPVLWWRSVYSSTNAFAHECFIDEVAHEAGQDPLQFRKTMLKEHPRFVKVLEILEEKGWNEATEEGSGKGVALAECFGSICGQIAKVKRDESGKLKLEKVIAVIDCGMTVNPDTIRAQTEGNIVMGLTAAIKSPIVFSRGRTRQTNFHNYQMLMLNEMPEVEVHIVQNEEQPGGVGEPGLPPLAPALANAIFNESGKRIRELPLRLDRV